MQRIFIFILICITVLSGAEVATIVTSVTPLQASSTHIGFFFGSLWLFLTGIATFIWHPIKQRVVYRFRSISFFVSLRQATLFSALLVLALFFNALRILTLWDILPLAFSTLLIEFFFQADTSVLPRNHEPFRRS